MIRQANILTNQEIAFQTREITMVPDSSFVYTPGQYITLLIPQKDGSKEGRSYSVASQQDDANITLLVRMVDGGLGSTYVRNLQRGDTVSFVGPSGKFGLASLLQDALFIATGTGAAPFVPMIDAVLKTGKNTVTLLLGFRQEGDSFFKHMTQVWQKEYPLFTGIEILSRPSDQWHGETGRVTDYLAKHSEIMQDKQLYICGNGDMVKEVITFAQQQGVHHDKIFHEKY